MKRIIALLILVSSQSFSADLLNVEISNLNSNKSRVTVRFSESIPLKSNVICNYYNSKNKLIASTNHYLLSSVTTWTVKAPAHKIKSIKCND